MSDVAIVPVRTRGEKKLFLEFPWKHYRDDPNWIPPLRMTQKELVGFAAHPFYQRNTSQSFLAVRDGQVCGRITAILNRGHNERYEERRGFFGFFESVDDQQVANALLDAVRIWLAEQGIYRLRGPTNPSMNYEVGLLIDGFDTPPMFMMTYNPPYYQKLLENYGFRKAQDLFAFWGHRDMLPAIRDRLAPIAEKVIEHLGIKLRALDRKRFKEDVYAFMSIYNRSLTNTWGFVPLSEAEVKHVARGLQFLIVPELAVGAELNGQLIGAAFGMPDYNPRIRRIDGRLFPFGFLRLLVGKKRIKRVRILSTNVLPEYQLQGVGLALMYALAPLADKWGLEEAEFSWVLESNALSYGSLKKGGAKITKTYRVYDLDEEPSAAPGAEGIRLRKLVFRRPQISGELRVVEVSSRAQREQFLRLPWKIYANDPNWVPPLLAEMRNFLDRRKHPFYQHGQAVQFLALRDDTPVGRILASDDPLYNEHHGSNLGCFGMFECFDDQPAAHALLDAAANWLRRRGREAMHGPIDYSMNYPCGLLIEGFDYPPRTMMNHHPIYYARLLESWGLRKVKDLYAWWFADSKDLLNRWREKVQRICQRGKVVIRPFDVRQFEADVQRCRTVYNGAMEERWGFVPLTDAEFHYLAKQFSRIAVPEQVLLAQIEGQTVGFALTVPDINEAIRPLNGRLFRFGLPINLLRLVWRLRRVKAARVVGLAILPGYRRRGVAELLIYHTLEFGKRILGLSEGELSWTLEDNYEINRVLEAVGARRYKLYRLYQRSLEGGAGPG